MIKGFLYGLVYFSLIPLLIIVASGFDLSYYPEKFFLTKSYELNFTTVYVSILIIFVFFVLIIIDRNKTTCNAETSNKYINKLRVSSKFIFSAFVLFYISVLIDFFYIDHSLHWLEREAAGIIPSSLRFYLNPIFSFVIFISAINISSSLVLFLQNRKLNYILSKWFFLDISLLALIVINSGNRWYVALLVVLFFYFSSTKVKIKITLFSPILIMLGGLISIAAVAMRTGSDIAQFLSIMFDIENIYNSFLVASLAITEGLNLPALYELANIAMFNPDPLYPIIKLLQTPIPGFLIDKLPPFNLHVTYLLIGYYSEWSLNTTLLGIFIYGLGIFSLPALLFFLFFICIYEKYSLSRKAKETSIIWFCLFFSGYRFGFEYLFVHFLYFSIIFFMQSIKIKKHLPS